MANKKLSRIIFYLILLFLPTQLGKHFWPDFAYVLGIRIDYLSPTIYFTDALIFILFIALAAKKFSIFNSKFSIKSQLINFKFSNIKNSFQISSIRQDQDKFQIVLLLVFLVIGIVRAKSPLVGWYGLVKLLEFSFFGYYVASFLGKARIKKELCRIALIFAFGIVFESVLAVAQFLNQGSLNGLLYFLGERTFTGQTVGIANASLNGTLVLRPYGTFPHPNVLAGYLTVAMATVISNSCLPAGRVKFQISNFKKIILFCSVAMGTIALFLTMSRVAILLWVLLLCYFIYLHLIKYREKKLSVLVTSILCIVILTLSIFATPLLARFTSLLSYDNQAIRQREQLNTAALAMFQQSPFLGVGIKNFLVKLPEKNPTLLIQPAHNIYLLVLAETGIVGFCFFFWIIFKTYRRIMNYESGIKNKSLIIHYSLFFILSSVLLLGLFDHYWLTLQQGQLLFSLVLGFCYGKTIKRHV